MMALEADRLSFSYGEAPVLSCASFGLPQGGFAALIGPNGAGKSTLLKLLLGELSPSSGAVRLLGQDTARFRNWRRLGYVPQDGLARHTDFPASVEEVVLANLSGEIGLFRFPRPEHRERVRQALELVGMAGYGRRLIGALSGGQRQRVLLARALIPRPEVMLLDEPTSGMDLQSGENFYRLLAGLNRAHHPDGEPRCGSDLQLCFHLVLPGRRHPGGTNTRTGAPRAGGASPPFRYDAGETGGTQCPSLNIPSCSGPFWWASFWH